MPEPQQPEIARSRKGATSDRSAKSKADVESATTGEGPRPGPVPADNQPGHHPPKEQDKPEQ
jgi:hypothetical protein